MCGQYGLSEQQLKWLNGRKMPKNFSAAKARSRMLEKSREAWDIFVPILRSPVVDQQFKDSIFINPETSEIHYDLDKFLSLLVQTYGNEPFEDIENKIKWAGLMVQNGYSFFKTRFGANKLVKDQIKNITKTLSSLEENVKQEEQNRKAFEQYRMRNWLLAPPVIQNVREDWMAECLQCRKIAKGAYKKEIEAIDNLEHDVNCRYLEELKKANRKKDERALEALRLQYIRTIPPSPKKIR